MKKMRARNRRLSGWRSSREGDSKMARIRIEALSRPEEELTGNQSSKVVGAGYYYGYGYNSPFYGGGVGFSPAIVTTPYVYGAATPFWNPVYAGIGGTSLNTPGFGTPAIPVVGFGGGYGPFRW